MIKLFNRTTKQYHSFETTIFPDKTSQVWKIVPGPEKLHSFSVVWMFENEAEYAHVLQLGALLSDHTTLPILLTPYLPYARQDKAVSNKMSFAGVPLMWALGEVYHEIQAFDCHSDAFDVVSMEPVEFFSHALSKHSYTTVCYPDSGAMLRYYHFMKDLDLQHVFFEKTRNQESGEITGLVMRGVEGATVQDSHVLVIDDLCDGGMTFIKTAEELYKQGAARVDLAVSHGLFSKGLEPLYAAGIKMIYTTNSLLHNRKSMESDQLSIFRVVDYDEEDKLL